METAYDYINEENLTPEDAEKQAAAKEQEGTLSEDLQDAYKTFSATPWGAKIGGFLGSVRKQGESYIQEARNEASLASEEALRGFSDLRSSLVSRARSMSSGATELPEGSALASESKDAATDAEKTTNERSESDALRESEGLIARFRTEAEKRLKDIQKAEDAADEALLKFGTNIRNFLRDAVTVAAPSEAEANSKDGPGKVLFESKDSEGRRVIHTTRFDAQLHVIHCSLDSFTRDPASPEWAKWNEGSFNVEEKTGAIAADLKKYDELRRAMERLVPEKVEYGLFWKRYYFLRMVIESEEKRRKEMLKDATNDPAEEIGWDEDSDDERATPQPGASTTALPATSSTTTTAAATTDKPATTHPASDAASATPETLKPVESRKSQDLSSSAGSDASYDLVSGATSRAPGSPRDEKDGKKKEKEESDEEDWE